MVNKEAHRDPDPCAYVSTAHGVGKGFAILKDRRGVAQFLLIPTARITGIEDPAILRSDATNYWDHAWRAHYFVEERLATVLPRDALSLAINSSVGRSQDQLHIHIDCIDPEVRAILHANLERVGKTWAPFPVRLKGHSYRAIRITRETLDDVNPFRVLADSNPAVAAAMGEHTLVVVGETFPKDGLGFVLLDGKANPATGNRGSGEDLQDHSCAVATAR